MFWHRKSHLLCNCLVPKPENSAKSNSRTVCRFPVLPTPCAKTREFGEAEFSDCLPVSTSVCVFAFDTGGLGLWLEAFGKSMFYRCQSVPGPPMPCFVAQSFALCNAARCLHSLCSVDMTGLAQGGLPGGGRCRSGGGGQAGVCFV